MEHIAIYHPRSKFATFVLGPKSCSLPQSWDEVKQRDLSFVLETLTSYDEASARALIALHYLKLNSKELSMLKPPQLLEVANLLKWMDPVKGTDPVFIKTKFRRHIYWMPYSKMKNVSALEYVLADEFYEDWHTNGNIDALNGLVGTLLRQQKKSKSDIEKSGDPRQPLLSKDQAVNNGRRLAGIGNQKKMAICLFFSANKQFIHNTYGRWIFDGESAGTGDGQPDFQWWGVFMNVAEAGIFGHLDKVHQTPFHTICQFLVQKRVEDVRIKRKARMNKAT